MTCLILRNLIPWGEKPSRKYFLSIFSQRNYLFKIDFSALLLHSLIELICLHCYSFSLLLYITDSCE